MDGGSLEPGLKVTEGLRLTCRGRGRRGGGGGEERRRGRRGRREEREREEEREERKEEEERRMYIRNTRFGNGDNQCTWVNM